MASKLFGKSYLQLIFGRNKEQTDYFVTSGENGEVFEPSFTYHGFRYVSLSVYQSDLLPEDIAAIVLYSDMKVTGDFTTSDSQINQLWKNIQWSQKGNMLSIPTDCPQREKAGWTGDLQVFAPTAAFNMDVQASIFDKVAMELTVGTNRRRRSSKLLSCT
jgi:alpha-L-rhamnosidase